MGTRDARALADQWCPRPAASGSRLTELGLDYVARQVPVQQESRDALRRATASSTIPALILEDGSTIVGEDAIRPLLDLNVAEPPEAGRIGGRRREPAPLPGGGCNDRKHLHPERVDPAPFDEAVTVSAKNWPRRASASSARSTCRRRCARSSARRSSRYMILGACNPPLAHRALETEPDLGSPPLHVVVYERDGTMYVSAVDAERMLSIVGNDALSRIAAEVRDRLAAVVEHRSPTGTMRYSAALQTAGEGAGSRGPSGTARHSGEDACPVEAALLDAATVSRAFRRSWN